MVTNTIVSAQQEQFQYGVIIDAGSSGSRVYVYKWPTRQIGIPKVTPYNVTQEWTKRFPGGIAKSTNVTGYMSGIVDFATPKVPSQLLASTPIYFKATAGMRQIPVQQQVSILSDIRNTLSASAFKFKPEYAKIISGVEEGVYGWLAVNFLMSTVSTTGNPKDSVGALDFGGASTQVTFYTTDQTWTANHVPTVVGSQEYSLYCYSYLGYGNDAFRAQKNDYLIANNITVDPCVNTGYQGIYNASDLSGSIAVIGGGNATECQLIIRKLLDVNSSLTDTSIDGNYQPLIPSDQRIVAFAGFLIAKQLSPKLTNQTIIKVGDLYDFAKEFCEQPWSSIVNSTSPDTLCFLVNAASELLFTAHRLPMSRDIEIPSKINGLDVTWALGAMVHEALLIEYYTLDSVSNSSEIQYGVIMDAGSTGTRVYVYEWNVNLSTRIPQLVLSSLGGNPAELRLKPGISSYLNDLSGLNTSISTLIDFAYQYVPQNLRSKTPLYLFATAGMRLLPNDDRQKILTSIRQILSATNFDFRRADVISGTEEGLFGWLSVNYLAGVVQKEDPSAVGSILGALDLGGASTQITFQPVNGAPKFHHVPFQIGDAVYDLYTYSYLKFGRDQARIQKNNYIIYNNISNNNGVYDDPCSNLGYSYIYPHPDTNISLTFNGTSNYTECVNIIRRILNTNDNPETSINGNYQPTITSENFQATDSYLACFDALNSTFGGYSSYMISISDLEKGAQKYCSENFSVVNISIQQLNAPINCFMCAHVSSVLLYGFKLDPQKTITMSTSGWTLGAMLFEASLVQAQVLDVATSVPSSSSTGSSTSGSPSTTPITTTTQQTTTQSQTSSSTTTSSAEPATSGTVDTTSSTTSGVSSSGTTGRYNPSNSPVSSSPKSLSSEAVAGIIVSLVVLIIIIAGVLFLARKKAEPIQAPELSEQLIKKY